MDINNYITRLTLLKRNFSLEVDKAINDNDKFIVGKIKDRLWGTGLDADNSLIGGGTYAPSTIEDKKKKGVPYGHFTLQDKGDFYKGMFIHSKDANANISSEDSKKNQLIEDYGEAILDLNEIEQDYVVDVIIEQQIEKAINKIDREYII